MMGEKREQAEVFLQPIVIPQSMVNHVRMYAALEINEDIIRVMAYYIWEANGKPEGKNLDHWFLAERMCNFISEANAIHAKTIEEGLWLKPIVAPEGIIFKLHYPPKDRIEASNGHQH